MSLKIRNVEIRNIVFGTTNGISNEILSVNKDNLIEFLKEDKRIRDVKLHIALPGDSTRIVPVKDVIEPRAKLGGDAFPGIDGEIKEVGQGITYVLKGCSVITTGPIVGFQEGVIDMSGPLTDYTLFSKLNNLVVEIVKKEHVEPHEHEEVVRVAGVRAAHYLGKLALEIEDYEELTFEWESFANKHREFPELPKVAYVYPCMSQGLLHDTYFYGRDSKLMIPTMISPLEVMDGAIVSGNCVSPGSKTTTYHHQNNAVIKQCFEKHGKEINFIGVVLNPLMTTLNEKLRNVALTGKLIDMMGVEGAIISQEGFGNPTTDIMMICKNLENRGIKTVLITNEDAGSDGMSESLPDGTQEADAIITTGNSNATIKLPKMDKIIGNLPDIERVTGGFAGCIQDNGELIIEIHGIIGGHNLQGNTYLSAVTI